MFHGDLEQVRREEPVLLRGVNVTKKLGFADVIMPGECDVIVPIEGDVMVPTEGDVIMPAEGDVITLEE